MQKRVTRLLVTFSVLTYEPRLPLLCMVQYAAACLITGARKSEPITL